MTVIRKAGEEAMFRQVTSIYERSFHYKRVLRALVIISLSLLSTVSAQFAVPVSGTVSDIVGSCRDNCTRSHAGLDVACNPGDPITASYGGTVQHAGSDKGGTEIVIDHGNGYWSSYSHMNSRTVPNGSTVAKGAQIGTCGDTGVGTGPHLHFQIANSNQGTKVYSPDGVTSWDKAAGLVVGQPVSINSELALAAPGLEDTGEVPPPAPGELATGDADPEAPSGAVASIGDDIKKLVPTIGDVAPNARRWFERTIKILKGERRSGEGPDVFSALVNLSWAMTFMLFVYAIVHANYFFRSDDYWYILGRLIVAVALISGAANINKGLEETWLNLYDYSEAAFADDVVKRSGAAVVAVAAAAPSYLLGVAALEKVAKAEEGGTAAVAVDAALELDPATWIARGTRLIQFTLTVLVAMHTLYNVAVFSSGLVVILGMLLLPIIASLLLWPGMGSYLTRWFSMNLTAFASLIIAVVIYGVALDLAFVIPLENLGQSMADVGNEAIAQTRGVVGNLASGNFGEAAKQAVSNVFTGASSTFVNLRSMTTQFILQGLILIAGVFMGFYLLLNFEGFLAGFLGGAASSGAKQVSAAVGGALAGGIAANAIQAGMDSFKKEDSGAVQMNASSENGSPALQGSSRPMLSGGSSSGSGSSESSGGSSSSPSSNSSRRGAPTVIDVDYEPI